MNNHSRNDIMAKNKSKADVFNLVILLLNLPIDRYIYMPSIYYVVYTI